MRLEMEYSFEISHNINLKIFYINYQNFGDRGTRWDYTDKALDMFKQEGIKPLLLLHTSCNTVNSQD